MALSTSKNTVTITLSNYQPTTDDIYFNQSVAIQGNTEVIFNLQNINADTFFGLQNVVIDFGDGTNTRIVQPAIESGKAFTLAEDTIAHTYYQTITSQAIYNAKVYATYFSTNTTKSLSATHNITIKSTPVNLLERNFELLGVQLITDANGDALPYLTLESDENIVYTTIYRD